MWLFGIYILYYVYIYIYIYIRPRLQHHLHVVPGLFEKTKETKQHWKNKRNHFPGVLGTEGASQESQNIVFFFVSPFFWFSRVFFWFSPWGLLQSLIFFPALLGGFLNFSMFFWFYPRGLLQRVIFFLFFCCAFPVFLFFFWFSFSPFFLFSPRGIKQNVSFFLSGVSVVLITIHERVKQTMGSWGG